MTAVGFISTFVAQYAALVNLYYEKTLLQCHIDSRYSYRHTGASVKSPLILANTVAGVSVMSRLGMAFLYDLKYGTMCICYTSVFTLPTFLNIK